MNNKRRHLTCGANASRYCPWAKLGIDSTMQSASFAGRIVVAGSAVRDLGRVLNWYKFDTF